MIKEENSATVTCNSLAKQVATVEYIWEAALKLGFPVAIWRLPNTDKVRLIVSQKVVPNQVVPDLEKLNSGYLMAPFLQSEIPTAYFLEADLNFAFPVGQTDVDFSSLEETPFSSKIFQTASSLQKEAKSHPDTSDAHLLLREREGEKERFQRIVQLGSDAVRAGQLFKVVLSRTTEFETDGNFNLVKAFLKLEAAYPAAFVSMVHLPHLKEVWLGASPEILVGVSGQKTFKTVALAGTQSATGLDGRIIPRLKVLWSEKEIEEQAIVSRYIIECFKRIRLREYRETGPRSSKAGNLYHLKSEFEVDMNAANFPELGSVMLRLLHPTSAVCGMPKEKALDLISALEGYDRSFYSGYWGPVNIENDTNLYVNLRTLRVKNGLITLFAGAGITGDSVPEEEWKETELKCNTILSVIDPTVSFKN